MFCLYRLDSTFWTFDSYFFSHIFGAALGYSISSTVINIVMEYQGKSLLNSLDGKRNFLMSMNICVSVNNIDYILKRLNEFHTKFQFRSDKHESWKIYS